MPTPSRPIYTDLEKRKSLDDLASLVTDGAVVAVGGGLSSREPMALLRAILRRGATGLTVVGSARTHAPRMVLVGGATYGIDPDPPFLAPTTNDWVMDREASSALDIEELFDLAAAGRMGRMFLSGLQIDRWGAATSHHLAIRR